MSNKTETRLLNEEFVTLHEVEDWGRNQQGWHAKVIEVDGEQTVALLPPNGKIWRAELPVAGEVV